MATNFLAELVDHPVERLDVEYKSTLDLTENKHRAALARHIAAIANFGGGYIVFGFDDETLTPCAEMPADFSVDRDLVGGITSKYLDPSLHCDVDLVEAMTGRRHFVITVPAHGSEPVCAKAGAPDNKGLIVGTYYTRKAGPKSEPITAASEWKDIIRRCALHERAAILSAVTAALTDATLSKPERGPSIALDKWSEAARPAYFAAIGDKTFHVPLRECHMQFSYLIELAEPQTLALQGFHDLARTVANQVEDNIKSGWPLFGVFGEAHAAPRWAHDPAAGETDFLQADFLSGARSIGYDFWRLAPSGMASILREFWEDTPDFKRGVREQLDPRLLARMLGQLITHAELYAGQFKTPTRVHFRCEWWALRGRRLQSVNALPFHAQPADQDYVRTDGAYAIGRLANEKAAIIADLGGRTIRAFNWTNFTAGWLEPQMSNWNRFG